MGSFFLSNKAIFGAITVEGLSPTGFTVIGKVTCAKNCAWGYKYKAHSEPETSWIKVQTGFQHGSHNTLEHTVDEDVTDLLPSTEYDVCLYCDVYEEWQTSGIVSVITEPDPEPDPSQSPEGQGGEA